MNDIRREATHLDVVSQITDIVRRHTLPQFIDGFDVKFGLDSQEQPAVWIVLRPACPLRDMRVGVGWWLQQVNDYTSQVRDDIIDSNVEAFPYFRIEPSAGEAASR